MRKMFKLEFDDKDVYFYFSQKKKLAENLQNMTFDFIFTDFMISSLDKEKQLTDGLYMIYNLLKHNGFIICLEYSYDIIKQNIKSKKFDAFELEVQ